MAARRLAARSISGRYLSLQTTPSSTSSILRTSSKTASNMSPADAVRRLHATRSHLSAAATASAPNYATNHTPLSTPADTPYFLDNKFVSSSATNWIDLHDPATNNLVTRVPQSTPEELTAAVDSAEKAFLTWKKTSVMSRQQIMFKYVALIRENWDRLAASITLEQGKTMADAKGDVLRGLQVAETACAIPQQMMGEVLEVAKDMETRTYREPLGVVAAICPFSRFPDSDRVPLTSQTSRL
jgi:malonate-semialdehyde dehydrogenase (acetylating) / methylmalonate-semialdehyde dehydrogenase